MQNSELGHYPISYHEINEDSHHMFPGDHYAMFVEDDDSCSCPLIVIKGNRKDTSYSEDRGQSTDERAFQEQDALDEENPEEETVEEIIQKVRGARIQQQDRIGSFLVQLTKQIDIQRKGDFLQTQKKSTKAKLIKKARR